MNKVQLINAISMETGLKKTDIESVVNAFMDVVSKALVSGEKVSLKGFGTFDTFERKASLGRVVKTGEVVEIPSHYVPRFKASASLKKKVSEGIE